MKIVLLDVFLGACVRVMRAYGCVMFVYVLHFICVRVCMCVHVCVVILVIPGKNDQFSKIL
jgi:hypothetical protein